MDELCLTGVVRVTLPCTLQSAYPAVPRDEMAMHSAKTTAAKPSRRPDVALTISASPSLLPLVHSYATSCSEDSLRAEATSTHKEKKTGKKIGPSRDAPVTAKAKSGAVVNRHCSNGVKNDPVAALDYQLGESVDANATVEESDVAPSIVPVKTKEVTPDGTPTGELIHSTSCGPSFASSTNPPLQQRCSLTPWRNRSLAGLEVCARDEAAPAPSPCTLASPTWRSAHDTESPSPILDAVWSLGTVDTGCTPRVQALYFGGSFVLSQSTRSTPSAPAGDRAGSTNASAARDAHKRSSNMVAKTTKNASPIVTHVHLRPPAVLSLVTCPTNDGKHTHSMNKCDDAVTDKQRSDSILPVSYAISHTAHHLGRRVARLTRSRQPSRRHSQATGHLADEPLLCGTVCVPGVAAVGAALRVVDASAWMEREAVSCTAHVRRAAHEAEHTPAETTPSRRASCGVDRSTTKLDFHALLLALSMNEMHRVTESTRLAMWWGVVRLSHFVYIRGTAVEVQAVATAIAKARASAVMAATAHSSCMSNDDDEQEGKASRAGRDVLLRGFFYTVVGSADAMHAERERDDVHATLRRILTPTDAAAPCWVCALSDGGAAAAAATEGKDGVNQAACDVHSGRDSDGCTVRSLACGSTHGAAAGEATSTNAHERSDVRRSRHNLRRGAWTCIDEVTAATVRHIWTHALWQRNDTGVVGPTVDSAGAALPAVPPHDGAWWRVPSMREWGRRYDTRLLAPCDRRAWALSGNGTSQNRRALLHPSASCVPHSPSRHGSRKRSNSCAVGKVAAQWVRSVSDRLRGGVTNLVHANPARRCTASVHPYSNDTTQCNNPTGDDTVDKNRNDDDANCGKDDTSVRTRASQSFVKDTRDVSSCQSSRMSVKWGYAGGGMSSTESLACCSLLHGGSEEFAAARSCTPLRSCSTPLLGCDLGKEEKEEEENEMAGGVGESVTQRRPNKPASLSVSLLEESLKTSNASTMDRPTSKTSRARSCNNDNNNSDTCDGISADGDEKDAHKVAHADDDDGTTASSATMRTEHTPHHITNGLTTSISSTTTHDILSTPSSERHARELRRRFDGVAADCVIRKAEPETVNGPSRRLLTAAKQPQSHPTRWTRDNHGQWLPYPLPGRTWLALADSAADGQTHTKSADHKQQGETEKSAQWGGDGAGLMRPRRAHMGSGPVTPAAMPWHTANAAAADAGAVVAQARANTQQPAAESTTVTVRKTHKRPAAARAAGCDVSVAPACEMGLTRDAHHTAAEDTCKNNEVIRGNNKKAAMDILLLSMSDTAGDDSVSDEVALLRKKLSFQNRYIEILRRHVKTLREEHRNASHVAQRLELLLQLQSRLPVLSPKEFGLSQRSKSQCRRSKSGSNPGRDAFLPHLSPTRRRAWAKQRADSQKDVPETSQQERSNAPKLEAVAGAKRSLLSSIHSLGHRVRGDDTSWWRVTTI